MSLSHRRARKTLWPSPAHTWHLPHPQLFVAEGTTPGLGLAPSYHDTMSALKVWLPWVAFPSSLPPARDPSDTNTLPSLKHVGQNVPFGTGSHPCGNARLSKPHQNLIWWLRAESSGHGCAALLKGRMQGVRLDAVLPPLPHPMAQNAVTVLCMKL